MPNKQQDQMMSNKNRGMNRRNFLRGSGVALALPWFEATAATADEPHATPKRFMSVYHPDGVGLPLKTDPAWKDWSWFPRGGEHDFELTKVLDVLEPLRSDITIFRIIAPRSAYGSRTFQR